MNLNQALKEIEHLKKVNIKLLKENEKNHRLIFKLNTKLNLILSDKEILTEKYNIERIKTFIPKSESISAVIINEVETLGKEKKIRKKKRKNFESFDFERHVSETRYEKPEIDTCPTCKGELSIASEKVRYVVESIPATLKVTKIIKQSCKCKNCNPKDNQIYYPLSTSLFPGSVMTHSFASYICYHKYELGIPFEHLSRHLKETLKIEVSKQNLALYMAKMASILTPIYKQMKDDLLNNQAKVIHADETTLSISKRPLSDQMRKKSYVYVYTSSYYDQQIAIYDFHESRAVDQTARWLKAYEGVIVCDDYAGYTKLKRENDKIKLQRCFAHARRRFVDILKALPQDKKKESYAVKILDVMGKLFHEEATYKRQNLLPSEILTKRQQDHPKILKELEDLIFKHDYKTNSAIEKAVSYTKKVWPELTTYLTSGYVEITNNIAERAVRPFVINRKVFMTSGSYDGARYTTKLFSIIRTARINDVNVSKYLEYVLDNINKKEIKDLLPYSPSVINMLKNN
ncbi:IS66 family transposase [Mariniplasma anaerobium]|nr:IS66 family transposase [Mariniplasma anaerobium]